MFSILKDKAILNILILGVLLRLLVMPFLFHPDIKVYNFQSSFLQKGVLNIYEYLSKEKERLPLKEEFVYFPLTYYLVGGYQWVISPLLGSNFHNWLSNASSGEVYPVFRYLFFLKVPILIFDLLCGFVLANLFEQSKRRLAFSLWLLNPFLIWILYVFSNVDIYPVFFILLSILMLKKEKYLSSGLFLGIGAAFKAFPLLLLPVLFFYPKSLKNKLKVLMASLGFFVLILAPFLSSESFRQSTITSGLTTRLLILNINMGFGESILVGIGVLMAVFGTLYFKERIILSEVMDFTLVVFLLTLSFIHFHIQWLLWVIPGLVYLSVKNQKLGNFGWFILAIGVLIPMLYEDKFMTTSLYSLINENFSLIPVPFGILSKIYDPYMVQSVLHTVFATFSVLLSVNLLRETRHESLD